MPFRRAPILLPALVAALLVTAPAGALQITGLSIAKTASNTADGHFVTVTTTLLTPEPGTLGLLGLGLAALGLKRRRAA